MANILSILGIDPGIAATGWGIVSRLGPTPALVDFGCLTTSRDQAPQDRLQAIFDHICRLCRKFTPSAAAVEDLFFNTNAKTALKVGEARGAVLTALAQLKVPVFHYTPLQVKQAITGYGRADKLQIQKMVKLILRLEVLPRPDDAADALAVALTHAQTRK